MKTIHFTKMQGLGNDFIVIDAVNQKIQLTSEQVRYLADRYFGIGCDQVLLVEPSPSKSADFFYRIYNADGSEVAQCGNGARCFARFVYEKELSTKKELVLATLAGQLQVSIADFDHITVNFGVPEFRPANIPFLTFRQEVTYKINIDNDIYEMCVLSVGNPHAVLIVEDVAAAPVATLGSRLGKHEQFPEGVNVSFMQICDETHIKLRVYERGAGETLACGSGAVAAVVAGRCLDRLQKNVEVELPGGKLSVLWEGNDHSVYLIGPAKVVFEGTITLL